MSDDLSDLDMDTSNMDTEDLDNKRAKTIEKYENARKPTQTEVGFKFLETMNTGHHAELSEWGMPHIKFAPNYCCLDVGCGGGANVKRMLGYCTDGKVYGLDYSQASVEYASQVNKDAIDCGRCHIVKGDVLSLPFDSCSFDVVTAYETVYFWTDIKDAFDQIFRVCKLGGCFFVCNESDGSTPKTDLWDGVGGHMKIYSAQEIASLMQDSGFIVESIDSNPDRNWISILGTRPSS